MIRMECRKMLGILAWVAVATGAVAVEEPLTAEQRAVARKTLLGALESTRPGASEEIRNPAGDYIYEATSARPVVEGGLCQIESNKVVAGLTLVRGLIVVARDLIAVMNPAYVNTNAPTLNYNYLDAPGLFSDQGIGIGPVSIEVAPAVSAEDVFVMPSVRRQTLGARITAANRAVTPMRVRVRAEVLDNGKSVLRLGGRELELAPNSAEILTLETPWAKPRYWEPTDPICMCWRWRLRMSPRDAVWTGGASGSGSASPGSPART